MSRTEIEPFASLHFWTSIAVAFGLEGGDEGMAQVESESAELLVDPDFGRDERAGEADDPVDRMGVGPDEMGDVLLELEGRLGTG